MKLSELLEKRSPPNLPQLQRDGYSLLWLSDVWDGPISGMLRYKSQEHWFEMFQENEEAASGSWQRRYAIVVLTSEQLAKEREVHEDFRRYVGAHWDYEDNRPNRQTVKQHHTEHHFFYDKHLEYCRSDRFDECEVTAWFEL